MSKIPKPSFASTLSIKECGRVKGRFELTSPLIYVDESLGVIIVNEGFCTDFATVPGFLKWIVDNDEYDIRAPSVIHDKLYEDGLFERKICDQVLYRAMLLRGAPKWKALLVYWSVRVFGNSHYKQVNY